MSLARLFSRWSLAPTLTVALALVAALYLLAAVRVRGSPWRACSFAAGLACVATALLSGIDGNAERFLSVHMYQHMLLLVGAPVFFVLAAPLRLALAALPPCGRRALAQVLHGRVTRALSRPPVGLATFAAVVLGTHLSGFYELALREPPLHELEHAAYLFAGLVLLAPLIAADPLPRPPAALARFGWLMAAMVATSVPGALLSFSRSLRYPSYAAFSSPHAALADQQLAGAVMWVGGGIALFALALYVVLDALLAEERRQRRRELYEAGAARA